MGRKDDQDHAEELSGRSKNPTGVGVHQTHCYLTENWVNDLGADNMSSGNFRQESELPETWTAVNRAPRLEGSPGTLTQQQVAVNYSKLPRKITGGGRARNMWSGKGKNKEEESFMKSMIDLDKVAAQSKEKGSQKQRYGRTWAPEGENVHHCGPLGPQQSLSKDLLN